MMTFWVTLVLMAVNIPCYKVIFHAVFPEPGDFGEAVRYYLTPDIVSWFRGEYMRDWVGEFKLGLFIAGCVLITIPQVYLVSALIRWIFG